MYKFLKQKNKKNRAFTLVETLVAISIFTVSILGMMSVLASGVSNTNYAKRKMTAAYLAQEGIEYIRNMRDTFVLYPQVSGNSWTGFRSRLSSCNSNDGCSFDVVFPHGVRGCNNPNDCKLYVNENGGYDTSSTGSDSGFSRKIWMVTFPGDQDQVKIFSKVEWTQGSGSYNITFSENLYNWIQ